MPERRPPLTSKIYNREVYSWQGQVRGTLFTIADLKTIQQYPALEIHETP